MLEPVDCEWHGDICLREIRGEGGAGVGEEGQIEGWLNALSCDTRASCKGVEGHALSKK